MDCIVNAKLSGAGLSHSRQKGIAKGLADLCRSARLSSHPPLLPAAAGGKREHWKALCLVKVLYDELYRFINSYLALKTVRFKHVFLSF